MGHNKESPCNQRNSQMKHWNGLRKIHSSTFLKSFQKRAAHQEGQISNYLSWAVRHSPALSQTQTRAKWCVKVPSNPVSQQDLRTWTEMSSQLSNQRQILQDTWSILKIKMWLQLPEHSSNAGQYSVSIPIFYSLKNKDFHGEKKRKSLECQDENKQILNVTRDTEEKKCKFVE